MRCLSPESRPTASWLAHVGAPSAHLFCRDAILHPHATSASLHLHSRSLCGDRSRWNEVIVHRRQRTSYPSIRRWIRTSCGSRLCRTDQQLDEARELLVVKARNWSEERGTFVDKLRDTPVMLESSGIRHDKPSAVRDSEDPHQPQERASATQNPSMIGAGASARRTSR